MIPALRAEFRKLLTVRSTYIVTGLVIALVCFIGFYVEGWRLAPAALNDPGQLASDVLGALSLSIFGAIIGILLMSHEYRYNTIMYTLTSVNRRSKVLLAKLITVSVYALFLAVLVGVLSPLVTYFGVHAHGHALVPQTLHVWDLAWRSLFYGWGYGMVGLLLAVLIRTQVGAIVALFLVPSLAEPLISQLIKTNGVYLPFTSLNQVIATMPAAGGGHIAPGKAVAVFLCYLIAGWIVAWVLFLRRDAN